MLVREKMMPWVGVVSMVVLAVARPVQAQQMANFRVPPTALQQETKQMAAADVATQRNNDRIANRQARNSYVNCPSGFYGYPAGYIQAPGGAFLSGASDVITSQGQLVKDLEQSKITREQYNQMRIDTRRKNFDEYLYERKHRPNVEDERERARLERMRRARNDPPITEIWNGKALNDLLDAIQKMLVKSQPPSQVPLDPEVLSRINVSSGANPEGSIGLLRDGGKLHWPLTLRMSAFAADRKKLDQLCPKALAQAQTGEVDGDTLVAMNDAVDNLFKNLKKNVSKIAASDYIKAKRYVNDLENTVKVLQAPDVSKYATRKWSAQGSNVIDLVSNMTRQGLRFAPAVPGDEASYVALHRAMVASLTVDPGQPWDPYAK